MSERKAMQKPEIQRMVHSLDSCEKQFFAREG